MVAHVVLLKVVAGGIAFLAALRNGLGLYAWMETEKLERPDYHVVAKLENGIELRRYDPYLIAETTVVNNKNNDIEDNDGKEFRESTASGFRVCAQYIFGKNQKRLTTGRNWPSLNVRASLEGSRTESEKMAMTAPVRISAQRPKISGETMAMTAPVRVSTGTAGRGRSSMTKGTTKVSFVIGKKYNKRTAPIPLNRDVKLREVPSHTMAVRQFSGPPPKEERVIKERAVLERALAAAGLQVKSNSETSVYGYHDSFITPNFLRRNEVAVLVEGGI